MSRNNRTNNRTNNQANQANNQGETMETMETMETGHDNQATNNNQANQANNQGETMESEAANAAPAATNAAPALTRVQQLAQLLSGATPAELQEVGALLTATQAGTIAGSTIANTGEARKVMQAIGGSCIVSPPSALHACRGHGSWNVLRDSGALDVDDYTSVTPSIVADAMETDKGQAALRAAIKAIGRLVTFKGDKAPPIQANGLYAFLAIGWAARNCAARLSDMGRMNEEETRKWRDALVATAPKRR